MQDNRLGFMQNQIVRIEEKVLRLQARLPTTPHPTTALYPDSQTNYYSHTNIEVYRYA